MAAVKDHIALANKNHEALLYLLREPGQFPEWITTVAFYKAVQLVEAVFREQLGRNCHTHKDRLRALKQPKFKDIFRHYRPLWAASCVARYLHDNDSGAAYSTFSDYISPEKVEEKIAEMFQR